MKSLKRFIVASIYVALNLLGCGSEQGASDSPDRGGGAGAPVSGASGGALAETGGASGAPEPTAAAGAGQSAGASGSDAGASSTDAGRETVTRANFEAAVAFSNQVGGDAVLVMQDGAILYEDYTAPVTKDTFHMLASGTKSFTCAIYALGAAKGYWTLETLASDSVVEWQGVDSKKDVRLKHLLSLSAGFSDSKPNPSDAANPFTDGYSARSAPSIDTYDIAINRMFALYAPDEAAIYTPPTFQIVAYILEKKNGGVDPVDFLQTELFDALGIQKDADHPLASRWTRDAKGKPQMAGGAYLTAREWAQYGKLMIQGGSYGGAQILDKDRVNECVTYRPPAFLAYGLAWWLNRPNDGTYNPPKDQLPSDGTGDVTQIAMNAPSDMYMAAGTGKQRLYVIPSLNLVVVRFGRVVQTTPPFTDHAFLGALLGKP